MKPKPPAPPAPPEPPTTPGPPLPVNIPVTSPQPNAAIGPRSLYGDMFGPDLSLVYAALDAPWASPQMRELAMRITAGERSINNLSTEDQELLDSMVLAYDRGGSSEKVRQAGVQGVRPPSGSVGTPPTGSQDQASPDPDVQPDEGPRVPVPDGAWDPSSAYSWTEEDG